jgi:hypothetical protein
LRCHKLKNEVKKTFEELLAKYKTKWPSHDQGSRPSKGKNSKLSPKYQNIPCSCKNQKHYTSAPYSYVGQTSTWSWSYPCYYSPLDYANLHIPSNMIQYISTYICKSWFNAKTVCCWQ